ncbi:hypothetical protein EUGRSUZ_E01686 [Eucalyptus grandis]|uniref:Uncharacterized protein n=2 Tax=Eucalyptus grandis TaxID=71139 RepID=A0ACC3KVG8_EUCGR|nr:hypothetical protein EUGRSUZ_E01686 [Eucalyptus grandis]
MLIDLAISLGRLRLHSSQTFMLLATPKPRSHSSSSPNSLVTFAPCTKSFKQVPATVNVELPTSAIQGK